MNLLRQKRFAAQAGEGTVTAMGVIGLALVFAALAYHLVQYYNARTKLYSLGLQIANYAGTFLPNAELACLRARNAYDTFKQNFVRIDPETNQPEIGVDANLRVAIRFYDQDGALQEVTLLNGADRDCKPAAGKEIYPPFDSLVVQLKQRYEPAAFTNLGDWSPLDLSVQFAARPIPTDVALVIDNSNSVVSGDLNNIGFSLYNADAPGRACTRSVAECADYKYRDPNSPTISRASVASLQCFGDVNKAIKTAAVRLFDLLSSAASYRVGVVHLLSPQGEFPAPTININSDSYAKVYKRWKATESIEDKFGGNSFAADEFGVPLFRISGPNEGVGWSEYESSRCAIGVGPVANRMPAHPLTNLLPAGSWRSAFLDYYQDAGLTGLLNDANADGAAVSIEELDFKRKPDLYLADDFSIAARDLIWINSAGRQLFSGMLDPNYDFAPLQFGILRAADMLKGAPRRKDKLDVRRKVVLLLTDGLERPAGAPGETPGPDFYPLPVVAGEPNPRSFVRLVGLDAGNDPLLQRFGPDAGPVMDNFCKPRKLLQLERNQIFFDTVVAVGEDAEDKAFNEFGYRLGVLLNAFRHQGETFNPGHPFELLRELPGHDVDNADLIDPFRIHCNTPWARNRGRFMVESDSGDKLSYYEELAPTVARALLDVETIETGISLDGVVN